MKRAAGGEEAFITVRVPKTLHKKLRIFAIENETSVQALMRKTIEVILTPRKAS